MKKTAHTPGPWKFTGFSKASNFADHVAVVQGDHCKLASVRGGVRDDKATAEANARLIAAAPDLYAEMDPEILEAIADEIDCFEHSARAGSLRSLAKRQRAALAKAEGRSVSARLSEHAMDALSRAARGAFPSQEANPGVVRKLVEEGLAVIIPGPSPYRSHKPGTPVNFLHATDAGRAELERARHG